MDYADQLYSSTVELRNGSTEKFGSVLTAWIVLYLLESNPERGQETLKAMLEAVNNPFHNLQSYDSILIDKNGQLSSRILNIVASSIIAGQDGYRVQPPYQEEKLNIMALMLVSVHQLIDYVGRDNLQSILSHPRLSGMPGPESWTKKASFKKNLVQDIPFSPN